MNQRVGWLGQPLRRSFTSGNTRQLARSIQRRDDLAVFSPTGAPPTRRVTQNYRCAALDGDLLQFSTCEKSDPLPAGRKERIASIFGSWQQSCLSLFQEPRGEPLFAIR